MMPMGYGAIAFRPPARAWSTNEDRNLNHYVRAELIKEWKEATIAAYWSEYGRKPQPEGKAVITVTIPVTKNIRRDPHNYCGTVVKAIIDGLIVAGAWPDDTPEYVGHREPVFELGGEIVVVRWE